MAKREDEDSEELDSGDLKDALKKLKKGPMNFALGYKDPRTPVMLMSKTKSAQALANELKSKRGASKATHGKANADGKALVLDVEGPNLTGMKKMVRTLLKQENSAFKEAKVRAGGVELGEEDGDQADLHALKAKLLSKEKEVGGVLKRLQKPLAGDKELLSDYGALCVEFAKQARESGDAAHAADGKAYAERAKKMVGLVKGLAGGQAAAAGAPGGAAAPGGGATEKYSGAAYSKKGPDGTEVNILSGEAIVGPDGVALSGVLAQSKEKGETNTIGGVEYKKGYVKDGDKWFIGEKAAVTGAKKEVDFQEKYDLNKNLVLKADVGVGTASSDASITDEGLSIGTQANAIEGSLTFGTTGTGDRDETLRLGLSAGEGAAGRVHWGDSDGDGRPEYGIGADVEFASFDLKTEDPLRKSLEIAAGPILSAPLQFVDGNMTEDAIAAGKDAVAAAGDLADKAGETVSGLANDAEDLADKATGWASDLLSGE